MTSEITNSNGELDVKKLFEQVQSLNSQLDQLQKEAEGANIMPTKNVSGGWIFKTEHINPDKIELLGKNAYAQALVLSELYEIQMQAMQLSVGSFDALKTVNKELTQAINIGFSESGAQNQQLFSKTQEQIRRIAVFAKNYADNLNELKQELSKEIEESLSKYVEADDVEKQIKNAIRNYAKKSEIEESINSLKKKCDDNIDEAENKIKNYIGDQISDLENKLNQTEENVKNFEMQIKIIDNLQEFIEKKIKESEERTENKFNQIEELVRNLEINANFKQKISTQTIIGLVLGSVGTILALLSIFVL